MRSVVYDDRNGIPEILGVGDGVSDSVGQLLNSFSVSSQSVVVSDSCRVELSSP
jgi:hypothetical protein